MTGFKMEKFIYSAILSFSVLLVTLTWTPLGMQKPVEDPEESQGL